MTSSIISVKPYCKFRLVDVFEDFKDEEITGNNRMSKCGLDYLHKVMNIKGLMFSEWDNFTFTIFVNVNVKLETRPEFSKVFGCPNKGSSTEENDEGNNDNKEEGDNACNQVGSYATVVRVNDEDNPYYERYFELAANFYIPPQEIQFPEMMPFDIRLGRPRGARDSFYPDDDGNYKMNADTCHDIMHGYNDGNWKLPKIKGIYLRISARV